jgi:hypothetical protein
VVTQSSEQDERVGLRARKVRTGAVTGLALLPFAAAVGMAIWLVLGDQLGHSGPDWRTHWQAGLALYALSGALGITALLRPHPYLAWCQFILILPATALMCL